SLIPFATAFRSCCRKRRGRSSEANREWRIANGETSIRYSLFAIRLLQRLALQQPRYFAGQSRSLADEQALQRRRAIDQAEPDIAHGTQQRRFVREQEVQRIGRKPHRHGVKAPPALVAIEHVGLPGIDTE